MSHLLWSQNVLSHLLRCLFNDYLGSIKRFDTIRCVSNNYRCVSKQE